jgi:hypothetical protein
MGRLRMPPINEDERFDLIEAEDVIEFLRLYQLSEDKDWHGLLKEPDTICFALTEAYAHTSYYTDVMWRLEAVGLLRYEAGDGWSLPDYAAWNAEDWAGLSRPRAAEQLGLDIPLKSSAPSPLNPVQAQRFGAVWFAYPSERRGARIECEREWRNLNPDDTETALIVASIPVFRQHNEDWLRGAIPQLRRFLHGQHWQSPPVPLDPQRGKVIHFATVQDRAAWVKEQAKADL